jgi:folate-binding protein YgfZ
MNQPPSSPPAPVRLTHRAVLSVEGVDAASFLNGLLTQSTLDLRPGERRYAALLTPQGKVISDLILEASPGRQPAFLLDVDAAAAPALLKRLQMFRLRAAVTIDARDDLSILAFAGPEAGGAADPRSPDSVLGAPRRAFAPADAASAGDLTHYHAARIAAGVAEQGADFGPEDVFPADINMDLLNGVDFRKGCFVGQEVVSRMKRRGTARRRTLLARLPEGAPATPAPILSGETEIGTLTSAIDGMGLARARIDRLAAASVFTAGGKALTLDRPDWLGVELEALKESKSGAGGPGPALF